MLDRKSNFDFLASHDALLAQLGATAEQAFIPDPNTTLFKVRQLAEALAQDIASRIGISTYDQNRQIDLLNQIHQQINLDKNVLDLFHFIRKVGNEAVHNFSSSHREAKKALKNAWMLSVWFHRNFGEAAGKNFKAGKFIEPVDPSENVRELEERIKTLERAKQKDSQRLKIAEALKEAEAKKVEAEKQRADEMASEREIWEALAQEAESKLTQITADFEQNNKHAAEAFQQLPDKDKTVLFNTLSQSTLDPSEADTRLIIDQQLNNAGWQADTENITYAKGARPEPKTCKAIAEWPTASGPADYVLFDGLSPVAVIEAKKQSKNVYSAIDQAKRYAKGFDTQGVAVIETTYGEYKVPLTFATNGNPYFKQLEQESGIWFLDVREPTNQRRALQGWYKPEEIREYLSHSIAESEQKLNNMDFAYDFTLRPYQIAAIKAVENSIQQGDQTALVAMATGTGKTKTTIALVYRLLKSDRFRRILFLVDRSALGEQAADDFKETRMENLNTFADIFDLKDLKTATPDTDTKVHIATVQGMVKRILYANKLEDRPSIGQYDCIVIDECHRGYLIDREMSDTEVKFRDQADYISKYRSVIEYFDAYKIGLTATPALHTSQIFGNPVYSYSYTEAVVDGFLIDHKPPVRIITKLAQDNIKYEVNDEVALYDAKTKQVELFNTPDELEFEVSQFNRSVITENFNRAVIKHLIEKDYINPYQEAKTLVFCVTDKHADMVVKLFHEVCADYHGEIEDDAIQKITGQSDKPLEKIKYFKNDRLPNIAVTVDLLTTGIDVPKITNLVFLRRVNSRILFEQMLGRATRRCDEIGKETFTIFDAVDIYDKLQATSSMKPVATDPKLTFTKLETELTNSSDGNFTELVRDQFIAKLQSKRRHLTDTQQQQFEAVTGQSPEAFIKDLQTMDSQDIADWFVQHQGLGEILDAKLGQSSPSKPIIISGHDDEVIDVRHGYGDNQKPEDYLKAFDNFVNANSNRLSALELVIKRPWELTRRHLKEVAIELEKNAFREQDLKAAWHDVKNEDIAARIMGFIRQAALGEPLIPWEDRVNQALQTLLAVKDWTTPQKNWLEAIAKQTIATTVVDNKALDNGILKDQQGGIRRANKLFDNKAEEVLEEFRKELWK